MTKIGLFFGSFDPPHIGHVDLVASALNAKVVDQVMVIPAWQNVWKSNSSPYMLRIDMCKEAFKSIASVSDIESYVAEDSGGEVYTYNVVRHLKEQYAAYGLNKVIEFVMLTSSETWKDIPKWKNGDKLIKEIPMIVEGIDFFANGIPTHSTQIRNMVRQGKLPQPAVTYEVYKLIQSNNLYR